ncbi:MAG: HNH endonuclease, partial [Dietzia sp.]
AQYRREQQRAEADAWARQQRRSPHPLTDPAAATEQATYFTRRAQRLNRERTQAATADADRATTPRTTPAPQGFSPADDSRWWQRNKPHHSTLEHAIRQALLEHLEKQLDQQLEPPPPF